MIGSDARIAQFCDQRSLRLNGNPLFKAAAIIARIVGHKIVRSLHRWRSLQSYGNQAVMYSSLLTVFHDKYRSKFIALVPKHAQTFCVIFFMLHRFFLV